MQRTGALHSDALLKTDAQFARRMKLRKRYLKDKGAQTHAENVSEHYPGEERSVGVPVPSPVLAEPSAALPVVPAPAALPVASPPAVSLAHVT